MEGWGQEIGPFNLILDQQAASNDGLTVSGVHLIPNPYAWNSAANMLYIDSPIGTGLSYADDGDYAIDDEQATEDLLAVLQGFFKDWPELQKQDFYLAGILLFSPYIRVYSS